MIPSQPPHVAPAHRRASHLTAIISAMLSVPALAGAQKVDVTITPAAFTFPRADPDVAPVVTSPALTVRYRVQQNQGAQWRITVIANGDLVSGAVAIPISNVTWTATPAPPFQNGTMNSTVEQVVASGNGNSPTQT